MTPTRTAPPRRRVAFVLTQDRGGPVDVTVALAVALADRPGFDVRLFSPPPARGLDQVKDLLVDSRVEGKGSARAMARARRRILDWHPDVVHAQDRRAGLVCARLAGSRLRPTTRRPAVVHTYHGVPDDVSQAWLTDPSAPGPSRYTRAVLTADALVARAVDRTVVVAQPLAEFLTHRLRVPADRVLHIDNGLTLPAVAKRDADGTIRRLLFVGLLVPRKGVDVLLRAMTRVSDGAGRTLTLTIVGDGPERSALERLSHDLVLDDRVSFLGFRQDIPDLMAVHDAFVLPARMEQQPLVLIEAMASGLPVVATDVGGVRDMLLGQGVLVAADDAEALAAALTDLARADPRERVRRSEQLSRHAHQRFGIGTSLDRHLRLYCRLRGWPVHEVAG